MTATAMPDTAGGSWPHRVAAIGSGLSGLTATKALKHDLANITDAVVFLTRFTSQGSAYVHNRTSLWLHVIPTTAAVLATLGVLIALYAAINRERTGPLKDTARQPLQQAISLAKDVCDIRSELGRVGAYHAIHGIA
jgi:hypothetical protein